MDCKEYRCKYIEFTKFPIAREIHESSEYENWQEHGFECEACDLWDTEQQVIKRGHDPSKFPCIHIAYRSTVTCEDHKDPWECPDMTIVKTSDGYGLPVRDGGSSFIQINNCPWCGIKL
jgi:hypothetical protein